MFVSTLQRLNLKWGTETPLLLEDPEYGIIVPVRAYGQYGFRISNAELFLSNLAGNYSHFSEQQLQSYFRGLLLMKLTDIIAKKIITDKIPILNILTHLQTISTFCENELKPYFEKYGIEIILFNIISINIPENDDSSYEIKKPKTFLQD